MLTSIFMSLSHTRGLGSQGGSGLTTYTPTQCSRCAFTPMGELVTIWWSLRQHRWLISKLPLPELQLAAEPKGTCVHSALQAAVALSPLLSLFPSPLSFSLEHCSPCFSVLKSDCKSCRALFRGERPDSLRGTAIAPSSCSQL